MVCWFGRARKKLNKLEVGLELEKIKPGLLEDLERIEVGLDGIATE